MAEKKIGTLIKVVPVKRNIGENLTVDSLLIFYRDENGVKRTKFVDRAVVPFYILKDKNSPEAEAPPMFIEAEKVDKVECYSDMLYREIALRTDSMQYYDRCLVSGGQKSNNFKNLLKHNLIYNADMDVADRAIKDFNDEYEADENYKLHKAYFDIEVDLMEHGFKKDAHGNYGYIGFPDENVAPCPINIITLIDDKTMNIHTFIVRNPLNTSLIEFESKVDEFIPYLKNKIAEEDDCIMNNIYIKFYDTEVACIEAFFDTAHKVDPDFCLAWNQSFDALTMINRLEKLYNKRPDLRSAGITGKAQMQSTICDTNHIYQKDRLGRDAYITPKAYYIARKDKSFVDRIDDFYTVDGINWCDQMLVYANVRKSTGMKESYALDAIAFEELGKEKLDYTGYTIKNLAWKNFWKFAEYNIRDVLLLLLLERKNLDFDLVQRLSDITNTRKEKVFKKTISLKNYVNKYAEENGFIMSNNKNAHYGNDGDYFDANFLPHIEIVENDESYLKAFDRKENFGAFVGDPELNDYCGINDAAGKPSKYVYEHVFDEDLSSLYPSIIRALNLDKNTQLGKFFLLDPMIKEKLIEKYEYDGLFATSKNEEAVSDGDVSTSDIAPTYIDSLMSHNWGRIGEKYFNLPSTADMIKELSK